jgi:hypothetical protein
LAGQVTQEGLLPVMKYWFDAQQTLVPKGKQNLVVPGVHVPEQVVTWASYRRTLSIVK